MSEYDQLMASRAALQREMANGGVEDETLPEDEMTSINDAKAARLAQDQATLDAGKSGSKTGDVDAAGDTLMAGGTMAGNPYVAGAGLALKTVGMVDDAVRQKEQAKIDAYNKQIMAQRSAIRNVFA